MLHDPQIYKEFIQAFQKEIRQSHYWQALPGRQHVVDVCLISDNEEAFGDQVHELIFSNSNTPIEWSSNSRYAAAAQHLFFEQKNLERLKGAKTFGLGYPSILIKNPNNPFSPYAAPIFIWSLLLEPSLNRPNTWVLRLPTDPRIRLNPFLFELFEKEIPNSVLRNWQTQIQQKGLNQKEMEEIISYLAKALNADDEQPEKPFVPFPSQRQASILAEKGAILWSGAFTLFPFLSPSLLDYYSKRKEELPKEAEERRSKKGKRIEKLHHPFGLYMSNPAQKAVLESYQQRAMTLALGPKGSGKTHTLVNILSNALSNRKKCLVIADDVHSLKRSQELLIESGIDKLSFLIKDYQFDPQLFLETLRQTLHWNKSTLQYKETEFDLLLNRTKRLYNRLEDNFKAIHVPIFGHLNWTETVGKFLASHKEEGKQLLSSHLSPNDFVFTFSEYEVLKEAISSSKPLYDRLKTLKHPLINLNGKTFEMDDIAAARRDVEEKLDYFLEKAAEIQHRYISKSDAYAEKLTEHYEGHFDSLYQQTVRVKDDIEDFKKEFGEGFDKSGVVVSSQLQLYGVFSNKHKNILKTKERIIEDYKKLKKEFQDRNYFDYRFPKTTEEKDLSRIWQALDDFEKTLDHWYQRLPNTTLEEVQKLNSKTVHYDLDYREQIEELEYALDVFIEELNNREVFEQTIANNRLTLYKRRQFIEEIIEMMENARYNLRDFEAFFQWQKQWLKLGPTSQKVIKALAKVRTSNWLSAFESWYFHNRLTLDYAANIPLNDKTLLKYGEMLENVQKSLPQQILSIWHKKLSLSIKSLKRSNKDAYNKLFGKNNIQTSRELTLREVIALAPDVILDAMPIIFTTPQIGAELFLDNKAEFDLILFDESDQLDAATTVPLLELAKRAVVLAEQASLGAEARQISLPDCFLEAGAHRIVLNYWHKKMHPSLMDFNTHWMSPPLANMGPVKQMENDPFELVEVEGRYDEEKFINDVEAQAIIRLLNQIEKTPQQTFPKVLIIATTLAQRNLISQYLLHIKQSRSAGSDKILQLERNGMAVLHYEELTGLEADVIILSFTFGATDIKGTLTKDIYSINEADNQASFRKLLLSAQSKYFLCHSLTEDHFRTLSAGNSNDTSYLFAQFLHYAKACVSGQASQKDEILKALSSQFQEPSNAEKVYSFELQLAKELNSYVEEKRLFRNVNILGVTIPLYIASPDPSKPGIVVITDGAIQKEERSAHQWELELRSLFSENGYHVLPAWSVGWWKNPRQEARKLASQIIRIDNRINTPVDSSSEG